IISKFIKGGFIDDQMKDASFDKHGAINRIGGELSGEIIYRNYGTKIFKNKNWGMQFQGGYYTFGGALYSNDLFGLVFYGNERYLGDTISMSGTDLSMVSFQKIGFGLVDAESKSSVIFNLYNISNRVSGDFRDLEIAQTTDGMNVDLLMDGVVEMSQNSKFSQGIGFGFDTDFRLTVAWYKDRDAKIQFIAKNFGFGYMHESQKRYSFDTTFSYSGFDFEQIIGDNAILNDSVNVLDTLGIQSTESNPFFILPGYLQVGKMIDNNSEYKLQSFFGVRVYPTLIYSPYIFAGANYKPLDWLNVGASVSFGGFAGFKAGLYSNLTWDKFKMGIGTDNFIGMVSKKGNGQSLYLKLQCII
ncbi:MAG: hypothetical protein HRT57_10350, partial [Crocinitomicaceae bacterium]|nr:hypothetical protein [Crocinitomicaceae bacterium]